MRAGTKDGAGSTGKPWRWAMWGAIAFLLLLPLVAMRFTGEVNWDGEDFAAAAVLLIGAGVVYELGSRSIRSARHRLLLGAALFAVVSLAWAEGAVGIF